jgi:hypothetical protein
MHRSKQDSVKASNYLDKRQYFLLGVYYIEMGTFSSQLLHLVGPASNLA